MTVPRPDMDQVLSLPAIEIRQGKQRIYMFGIDGKELPRIATISRVHRDDEGDIGGYPVSYTHLTLPTICSV